MMNSETQPNASKIIETIKNKGITAFEIAKNTDLSEVGINKILNGKSKNPQPRTLLILQNYLEQLSNENNFSDTEILKNRIKFLEESLALYKEKAEYYQSKAMLTEEMSNKVNEIHKLITKDELHKAMQKLESTAVKKV